MSSITNLGNFPHTVGNLDDQPNLNAEAMKAAFETDCATLWGKVANDIIPAVNDLEQLSEDVRFYSRDLNVLRYGRLLDQFTKNNRSKVLFGQSTTYRDGLFYNCGNYNSDANQGISVWDSTGVLQTYKNDYTDLGHANSITSTDDYLFIATGVSLAVVNRSTLAYVKTISFSADFTTIYGASCDEGIVYVLGYDSSNTIIAKLTSVADGTYEIVTTFDDPANTVRQGFTVLGDRAYVLYNMSNMIYRVNLTNGDVEYCYYIPDGDGVFPCGECEDLFKIDGDIYISAALYLPYTNTSASGSVSITQIFKTDIVNPLQKNQAKSYMMPQEMMSVTVNGNATYAFNPALSALTTIEEACHILNYWGRGEVSFSNVTEGYLELHDGTYSIIGTSGTRHVDAIDIVNASVMISQVTGGASVFILRSKADLKSISISALEIRWSTAALHDCSFLSNSSVTQVRSSVEYKHFSSIASGLTASSDQKAGNDVKLRSSYKDLMVYLGRVMSTGGQINIYNVTANEPITAFVPQTDISSDTWTASLSHSVYNQLSCASGGVLKLKKISDGTTITVPATALVEMVF